LSGWCFQFESRVRMPTISGWWDFTLFWGHRNCTFPCPNLAFNFSFTPIE
jgi:hypothetical protein